MSADSHSSQAHYSSGERLRSAREQQGWSIQETAEMLHVIPRYVRAIENADFSQLPGLVFLKGYVRSYSRLVGLPEDSLIADLENELITKDDPILTQEATTAEPFVFQEIKPKKFPGMMILGVVFVAIVVAIIAGYLVLSGDQASEAITTTSGNEPVTDTTDTGLQPDTQAQAVIERKEEDPNLQYSRDPVTGEIKLELNLSEPAETAQPLAQPESTPANQNAADDGTLVNPDPENSETRSAAQDTTSQQAVLSPEPATQTQTPSADVQTVIDEVAIVAKFTGDCWFDVRDRNNERIVGLYRAGDWVSFNGQFPVKFIVGAVNAVKISVNNQLLDFGDYPVNNNRAEFTLDQ